MKTKIILYIALSLITAHQLSAQVTNGDQINYQIKAKDATVKKNDSNSQEEIVVGMAAAEDTDSAPTQVAPTMQNIKFFGGRKCASGCENRLYMEFKNLLTRQNFNNHKIDVSSVTWEHETNPEETFGGSDDQRVFLKDTLTMTRLPTGKINELDLSSGVDNSRFWMKWRYSNGTKDNPLDFGTLPESGTLSHVNANYEKDGVFKPFPVLPQFDIPVTFDDGLGYSNEWIGSNGGAFAPGDEGVDVTYQFTIEKGSNVTIMIETAPLLIGNVSLYLQNSDDEVLAIAKPLFNTATRDVELCAGDYLIIVDSRNIHAQAQFTLNVTTTPLSMYPGSIVGENTTIDQCVGADFGKISNMATATAVNYDPITYLWERSINGADWDPVPVPASEDTNHRDLSADHAGEMPDVNTYQFRRRATSCGVSAVTAAITFNKEDSNIDPGSIQFAGNTTTVKIAPNGTPPQVESDQPGTGMPGPVTYQWQKEVDGAWEAIAGATSASYTPPAEQVDTKYRRVTINDCDADDFSNEVTVDVLEANGKISGRVIAPNNGGAVVGVADIVVTATRTSVGVIGGTSNNDVFTSNITNSNGEYTIDNIYYGEIANGSSTEFTLTAKRSDETMDNFSFDQGGNGTVTLSTSNREKEQNIIDNRLVPLTGQVFQTFMKDNGSTVQCGIDSVGVMAGAAIDSTSREIVGGEELLGFYSIAVPQGNITITPSFGGHVFSPPSQTVTIGPNGNDNVNFNSTTTHTVSGFVGACGKDPIPLNSPISNITEAYITFSSPDLCIQTTRKVNSDGTYSFDLPARKYNAMVTNFDDPGPFSELEVLGFFQNVTEIDLRTEDVEHDFIYRPQPSMIVTGFPAAQFQCIDRVIMKQGESKTLQINVFEGPSGFSCPLDTGLVLIADDISDRAGSIIEIPISDGIAEYEILPGDPNVIGPHFKNISITAMDTTGQSVNFSQDVVVTGTLARPGTFATVSPEIPSLILRDPPGDQSYAFIENEQSFETTTSFSVQGGGSVNAFNKVKLGIQFETGFIGFATGTENYGQIENSFSVTGNVQDAEELTQTYTTTRKFSTSDDDQVVGAGADVFVGAALNIIYGVADIVEFDDDACLVILDKDLVISPTGFATEYVYTRNHIENVVIGNLQFLADNGGGSSGDDQYRETVDGLPQTPEYYLDQIKVWEQTLQRSDLLKDRAIAAGNVEEIIEGQPPSPYTGNISFGAGAGAAFTTQNTSSETESFEWTLEIEAGIAAELGFEIGGTGASGGVGVTVRSEVGKGSSTTTSSGVTVGVVLGDDDTGDTFTADMLVDPVYQTPIFDVISGVSSCPYEGSPTQPRDRPELSVNTAYGPPVVTANDPDGTALFELILANNTDNVVDDDRVYLLSFNSSSVGGFPGVTINGGGDPEYPNNPNIFRVERGETALAEIVVERNLNRNDYAYEGIEIIMLAPCDPEFRETVQLSAFFPSPCSDITLVAPIDEWTLAGGSNNIQVIIKDYDVNLLEQVQIQIAPAGQSNWVTIGQPLAPGDLFPNGNVGTQETINLASIPDGEYNIRAQLTCAGGISTSSMRARGTIKRAVPEIAGIPYPADDEFDQDDPADPDSLSVIFDDVVSCDQAVVTLTDIATEVTYSATVMCSGDIQLDDTYFINTASVFPDDPLPTGEYAVELCGMIDEVGNEIECFTWFFNVNVSELAEDCGPLDVENNNFDGVDPTNAFSAIESGLYQGATVKSDNIIITPAGDVHFQGEVSVSLDPGFEVPSNSIFLANIEDCDETLNDPIPCEYGIPIVIGNFYTGDTNDAIPGFGRPQTIPGGTCAAGVGDVNSPGEWYYYRGQGFDVDFSVCGYVGFDIILEVFNGDCKEGLFCLDDGGFTPNASIGWFGALGQDYYIYVRGRTMADVGEYTIVFDTSSDTPLKSECNQIYVDKDAPTGGANDGTSWADAYTTVQDALADTSPFNAEIWVADGTYYTDIVNNDRDATFSLNPNQTIIGGLAGNEPKGFDMDTRDFDVNETILSGEIGNPQDPSDNSYHVVTLNQFNATEVPILDGLTIEKGYADAGANVVTDGASLDFDSANADHVEVTQAADFNFGANGGFTFEAWVNPSASGDDRTILSKGHGGNGQTNYIFNIGDDGRLGMFLSNSVGGTRWLYSNAVIPNDTWTHVAVTVERANDGEFFIDGYFYVNGIQERRGWGTERTLFDADSNPFYIGRQGWNCNCNFFDGKIDDLAIWNKVLTQAEINASIAGSYTGNEPNMVAYYTFDDGTPCASNSELTTLTDQTSNGHNGSLENFDLIGSTACRSNWAGGRVAMSNPSDGVGGGLLLETGLATIHNCTFRDNYALSGGAVNVESTLGSVFLNNLFLGNEAEVGGAMHIEGTNSCDNIGYSTFYGNQSNDAAGQGDAIASAGTLNIINSILWGNNPDSLGTSGSRVPLISLNGSTMTTENNIIENGAAVYGTSGNNQFTDPQFVSPDAERNLQDYRLQDGSPAIDAGIDIGDNDIDINGFSRSTGGAPDLGPYESGVTCRDVTDADEDAIIDCQDLCPNTPDISLDFDGGDDHIVIPHANVHNLTRSNFTIQAWVFIRDNSANTILSKGDGTATDNVFSFVVSPEGDQQLGLYLSSGSALQLVKSNGEVPLTTWTHVAVSFDLNSKTATFFINGVQAGPAKVFTLPSFNSTDGNPLYIGRNGHVGADNYFHGRMDNLSIWREALNKDQITNMMSARLDGDSSDLADSDLHVNYEFNDSPACVGGGTSLSAKFRTGSLYQGTLVNFNLNGGCISNFAPGANLDADGGGVGDACTVTPFYPLN